MPSLLQASAFASKHANGCLLDLEKISTFATLPTPTIGKQIQSILGFTNFVWDYIPCYAEIMAPLEPLWNIPDIRPYWNDDCQQALDTFKHVISSPTILSAPDWDKLFYVGTDASQHGVGAVLYQEDDNGKCSYICFASKALNPTQHNYPSIKRELLAIIFTLHRFYYYLISRCFLLYINHRPLVHLFNVKDFNSMLMYWALVILHFNFEVFHRPGIHYILEGSLSQLYTPSSLSNTCLIANLK